MVGITTTARRLAYLLALLATVGVATSPARATVTFSAGALWTDSITDFDDNLTKTTTDDRADDSGPTGAHVLLARGYPEPVGGNNFRSFTGEATAAPDGLRASAFGHTAIMPASAPDHHLQIRYQSGANASVTIDNLVFTGPGGTTSVSAGLNLVVSGLLTGRFDGGSATGSGNFSATLNGDSLGGVVADFSRPFDFDLVLQGVELKGQAGSIPPSVQTRSVTMSGAFKSTRTVSVPLGVPVVFQLTLATGQDTLADSVHNALGTPIDIQVSGDFAHTVAFPSSGPIFDLPPGYSVSSADGLIVDNQRAPLTGITTTTTSDATTTSTTLPGGCGGLVGITKVDCLCHAAPPAACGSLPGSVTGGFLRACGKADAAAAASGGKARKLYGAAFAKLRRLAAAVGKRKTARKLGTPCVAALQSVFGDVRTLIDGLRPQR